MDSIATQIVTIFAPNTVIKIGWTISAKLHIYLNENEENVICHMADNKVSTCIHAPFHHWMKVNQIEKLLRQQRWIRLWFKPNTGCFEIIFDIFGQYSCEYVKSNANAHITNQEEHHVHIKHKWQCRCNQISTWIFPIKRKPTIKKIDEFVSIYFLGVRMQYETPQHPNSWNSTCKNWQSITKSWRLEGKSRLQYSLWFL